MTLHFRQALLPHGWHEDVRIRIADGMIAGVETGVAAVPSDDRHAIAIPGMANLHSHAFQRAMAGLAEVRGPAGDSFWSWRETMYRFLQRIDPAMLSAIAALAYAEMLEAGFTRVGEFHYLHHSPSGAPYADPAELSHSIAAAAAETGIGLTHLPVFYAHSGFGGADPSEAQARFVTDLDAFARIVGGAERVVKALPDGLVGVAPHSLRAVTPDALRDLDALADEGPIHIHIAEQVKEVDDCLAWSGRRPVEWLLDHARVDSRWCLVHATHMTESETVAVARSGAVVGLCPVTEANLGDGVFPAVSYREAGGAFGIGTDSNVRIDMAEELRLLEYGQRLTSQSRNVLAGGAGRSTGQALFDASLAGGARALGARAGLATGQVADIVALDAEHPSMHGRTGGQILDSFVFAAGQSAVHTVWRRGRRVVEGGRHIARDEIAARYRIALDALAA